MSGDLEDMRTYSRGYEDGRRSKDAEHAAVALKLSRLRFDGGSHENLHKIAYAIYPCATGWTCESANGLRERLIDLMGGVHEHRCGTGCDCACDNSRTGGHGEHTETMTYDVLQAKLEEADAAIANWLVREKSFEESERERDELRRSLRQIAERAGVPHDRDLSEYSDKKIANAVVGQLGQTEQYVKSLEWVRDKRLPRIEAERDELKAKLDAIREALDE